MGERDLSPYSPPGKRRGWARWLVPAVLLAFLTVLEIARPAAAPTSAGGVAHYLHAASLAHDQDAVFASEDLERLRQLPQPDRLSVLLARADDDRLVYPGAGPEALWLAPFVAVAGLSGAVFATALAVVWAMGLAATTMRQRLHTPWGLLLLALLASTTIRFVLEPRAEAIGLAAVLAAFALAFRGESSEFVEMPEVYDDALRLGGWRFTARWLGIGALLAVAALSHPLYLLLFLPAALAVPERARRSGIAWLLGGGALLALPTLVASGALSSLPWLRDLAAFDAAAGFPTSTTDWGSGEAIPSLLGAAAPQLHVGLLGWNLAFLAVGRTVGAVPYFLPVLLMLALWEPRSGRSPLVVAVTAVALTAAVVWPFDWAGEPGGLGNALLLPAFGALWLVPTRPVRFIWLIATTILAGALLWPTWLDLLGLRPVGSHGVGAVPSYATRWLPVESSLRVGDDELLRGGSLAARIAGGALGERGGELVLSGGRWGSLMLVNDRPVESVLLDFDGQAGTDLEVEGGELGSTVFRGDGGIGFEVRLGESDRRHPVWWSSEDQSLYDLRLRLPSAPPFPVAFRVSVVESADR